VGCDTVYSYRWILIFQKIISYNKDTFLTSHFLSTGALKGPSFPHSQCSNFPPMRKTYEGPEKYHPLSHFHFSSCDRKRVHYKGHICSEFHFPSVIKKACHLKGLLSYRLLPVDQMGLHFLTPSNRSEYAPSIQHDYAT
jgi:hypothetical protein